MRVVKVEDLLNQIEDDFNGVCVYDVTASEAINDFENAVYSTGIFNIVTCGECKYCVDHYCTRNNIVSRVKANDFCSWGEQ